MREPGRADGKGSPSEALMKAIGAYEGKRGAIGGTVRTAAGEGMPFWRLFAGFALRARAGK